MHAGRVSVPAPLIDSEAQFAWPGHLREPVCELLSVQAGTETLQILRTYADDAASRTVDIRDEHEGNGNNQRHHHRRELALVHVPVLQYHCRMHHLEQACIGAHVMAGIATRVLPQIVLMVLFGRIKCFEFLEARHHWVFI